MSSEKIGSTYHGRKRIEDRISKDKIRSDQKRDALSDTAFRCGLKRSEINGTLYRWVERRCYMYPGNLSRIYRDYLFIYSSDTPYLLITVYPVPGKMLSTSRRLEKKKRKNGFKK